MNRKFITGGFMKKFFLALLLVIGVASFANTEILMIENFDSPGRNTIGGWTSTFQRADSFCKLEYKADIRKNSSGYNGRVTLYKANNGFSGFWIQTLDFKQDESKWKLINLFEKNYKFLSFKIYPLTKDVDFLIKVADKNWVKKEDSIPVGKLSEFLKNIRLKKWQEVIIPVKKFKRINKSKFAEIVFESIVNKKIKFLLDDICLKENINDRVKLKKGKPSNRGAAKDEGYNKVDRAMWVWHSDDYLVNGRKLIKFCKKYNINILFCQAIMEWKKNNKIAVLLNKNKWKKFIRNAHKHKIEIHLLDGYKEYALTRNHIKMLSQVKAIIDYNKSVKKIERFDGIHHDNEVYLNDKWKQGLAMQKNLLVQSLLLIKRIQYLIKHSKSNLVYGVDIPFWYDEADTEDGKGFTVTFDNRTESIVAHLIRLCDNVGIMDYRNFAYGPDGIITHGEGEVKTASNLKKKSILIGVETIRIEPTKITFYGQTKQDIDNELKITWQRFKNEIGFRGFAIHFYRTYKDMPDK